MSPIRAIALGRPDIVPFGMPAALSMSLFDMWIHSPVSLPSNKPIGMLARETRRALRPRTPPFGGCFR